MKTKLQQKTEFATTAMNPKNLNVKVVRSAFFIRNCGIVFSQIFIGKLYREINVTYQSSKVTFLNR